ncbi:MAG: ATP-dependent Clp protease ATP-binding subunit [Lewinellaceae bacterium]|nr:ATP-dependent Clp protease ATP-binding subunit [Lewinellaceae bacterium]
MAYPIAFPFYAFRLQFHPGVTLTIPLADLDRVRMGTSLHRVAKEYESTLQEAILGSNGYLPLAELMRNGEFRRGQLHIPFSGAADLLPSYSLSFTYYSYTLASKGMMGVIPELGLEAYGETEEEVQHHLELSVRTEFARSERLLNIRKILSAIWFRSVELVQQEILLEVPDPGETLPGKGDHEDNLLNQAANLLQITQQECFGREKELQQLRNYIQGRFSNNILVVGPSGVGKTALIWEIARRLEQWGITRQIWETSASLLIKELMQEGAWENQIPELCKILKQQHAFLYVRNLFDLFEVGKYEGNENSVADYLQPYLQRGDIAMISECTDEQLALIELNRPGYAALFHIIRLQEPKEELVEIIRNKIAGLSPGQTRQFSPEAVPDTIRLMQRFSPYAGMPGKAIRFLEALLQSRTNSTSPISGQEVIRHFCEGSGLPLFMVDSQVPLDLASTRQHFQEEVFGQPLAVQQVVNTLITVKTDLNRKGKPIASFLFVGPTGVGKTELAKVLAGFMFGDRSKMLRFDMSEYSDPYSVQRLISGSEGKLTAAVRRNPFSVLLLDELEKADSSFFDLLLQVLGDGRLTDSQGRLADFSSAIIIMTSNIGASAVDLNPIGFDRSVSSQHVQNHFLRAVQRFFRPELVNRIDQIIPFLPLGAETMKAIVDREISLIRQREGVKYRKLAWQIEPQVLQYLAQKGFDPQYGARYLQRVIREEVLSPLAAILVQVDSEDQVSVQTNLNPAGEIAHDVKVQESSFQDLYQTYQGLETASYAASLRRSARQFQEGFFFTELQQEWEALSFLYRTDPNKLFSQFGNRYQRLDQLIQRTKTLFDKINQLEEVINLETLGLKAKPPTDHTQSLAAWSKEFEELRTDLYLAQYPNQDCRLQVIGSHVWILLILYHDLISQTAYQMDGITGIWFDPNHYQQYTQAHQQDPASEARPYIEQEYPTYFDAVTALRQESESRRCVGVSFRIKGAAPELFFKGEVGLFKWWMQEEKQDAIHVIMLNEEPLSDQIHRREFFRGFPQRRSYNQPLFRDSQWKISRELEPAALATYILEYLKQRFQQQLDLALR